MTDREALLALLARFNLTPSSEDKWPTGKTTVTLAAQEGGVSGYSGFIGAFDFDEAGKFQAFGLYE